MQSSSSVYSRLAKLLLCTVSVSVLSVASLHAQQVRADGTEQTASGAITTTNSPALHALNGGTITGLAGLDVTTTGGSAYGAWAGSSSSTGQNSSISLIDTNIRTSGSGAYGIYVNPKAHVAMNGGTITVTDANTSAVNVLTTGSASLANVDIASRSTALYVNGTIALDNSTVISSASSALLVLGVSQQDPAVAKVNASRLVGTRDVTAGLKHAVRVDSNAILHMTDSQVEANGDGAYGFWFSGDLAGSTIGNTSVTTAGNGAHGITLQVGTIPQPDHVALAFTGGEIITNGNNAYAIYAGSRNNSKNEMGAVVEVKDAHIVTRGNTGIGLAAFQSSVISSENVSIETAGSGAVGLYAGQYARHDMVNSAISTTGQGAHGVYAIELAKIDIAGSSIATTGENANGLRAQGGETRFSGTRIETAGHGAIGALLVDTSGWGTRFELMDGEIATAGFRATGLKAQGGASASLGGQSAVITGGDEAFGLLATGVGSTIIADQVTVSTAGTGSNAVVGELASQVTFSNGKVQTRGDDAVAIQALSENTQVSVIDSEVNVSGHGANGAVAYLAASLDFSGGSITSTGAESFAAAARDADSVANFSDTTIVTQGTNGKGLGAVLGGRINVERSTVTTSGTHADGVLLYGGGTAEIAASTITTQGSQAAVVYAFGTGADVVNSVQLTDSTLTSKQADLVKASGAKLEVQFDHVVANSSNGKTLNVVNDAGGNFADVQFRAAHSSFVGDIFVDQGSTAQVELLASSLTGAAENLTTMSLDEASLWNLTGHASITGRLSNAGHIRFEAPSSAGGFKTLTLGDYSGGDGMITLNTALAGDDSATDRLNITGDSSGATMVAVRNAGGKGALTTEGIEIIRVAGNSAGQFSLAGEFVVAGAHTYRLHRNNASGTNPNDWYLRSVLTEEPGEPTGPVTPTDPDKPTKPTDPKPEYHVGSPAYEAYPQALLGLNGLPSLQERVGNRFWAGNGNRVIVQGADLVQPVAEEAGAFSDGNGVWGRIEGAHHHIEPRSSLTGSQYDQNLFKLQAGIDGLLADHDRGQLIASGFVHYAHGKTTTSSRSYADGEISTNGYGFGGALTWYGTEGLYVDGQAQVTWYDSDLASSARAGLGLKNGNSGIGYAVSLEGGRRFALDPAWSLTPQAQLVWSSVDFDSFNDSFGSRISLDRGNSLQGRLGVTLDHQTSWQNANGQTDRAHVYGLANLYQEFLEGTRVDIADTRFATKTERTWGGIGLGGTRSWSDDKFSIHGEGSINTSLSNFGDSYSVKGNIGLRVKW